MLHYKTKRLQYQKYYFSFGGKNGDTLASLRDPKFIQAVVTCAVLNLKLCHVQSVQCIFTHYEYTLKFVSGNILIYTVENQNNWVGGKLLKPIKTD